MTAQTRVQLMQINNCYGNQFYIPYTVGALTAFARQFDDIRDNVEFRPYIYRRGPVKAIADQIGKVDILGASCYVWNMALTTEVAIEIKRRHPDTLIIFGGPHVPDLDPEFLDDNPFIDIAVHGEGEETFLDILRALRGGKDFSAIPGTSVRAPETREVVKTENRTRMRDISGLPSAYLEGLFDNIMEAEKDASWNGMWETNRGCPFQCAFCDWGSLTASKVLEFDRDRVMKEIEWFSDHKIEYLFAADANFGIRKRDIEIAEALADAKSRTGFPQQFRVCFTKNSTEKTFAVAKTLNDKNMLSGISLSMQSLDPDTLKAVKRDNIKLDVFEQLMSRYNEANVTTYTEIILALPGETYDSFATGIDTLFERGQHSQVVIYNCTVMPNAEMGNPAYLKEHGIKTVEIPIFTSHASPRSDDDPIVERESVIIETKTMPNADWRRAYHFAWAIQCFHALGILQAIAIFLRNRHDVRYQDFYESLIAYAKTQPESQVDAELNILDGKLDDILAGIGLDQYMPEFSDVTWPLEEASFLRLTDRLDELFDEMDGFLRHLASERNLDIEDAIIDDLIAYQMAIIVSPRVSGELVLTLDADIPDFVSACREGRTAELTQSPATYRINRGKGFGDDKETYARQTVWYGRKGGKFKYPIERAEQAATS
ncbi:MAG: radical SAM protein [Rhodospirillales bacterium]